MKTYGCIGKKLTHSFSKEIHSRLADYKYDLIELNEDELESFFEKKDFEAINVTIPYKEAVIKYLDFVSDTAGRIGAVNTIVKRNGRLYGYNTDYYGMKALVEKTKVTVKGKKVLVLGSGGTSKTAVVVCEDMEAGEVVKVSRSKKDGCITYEEAITCHDDANVIINTTPVGMYPDWDFMPIDLESFKSLEGVVDAIYNPLSSMLVSQAKQRGIKSSGGLYMLVMQAAFAVEKFLDKKISQKKCDEVFSSILLSKENIVLTGMPGSGKSTVGKLIKADGFEFVDTDAEVEKRAGCSIKDLIETKGEKHFRDLETEVIRDVSLGCCRIIATGGGAVLRKENIEYLKRNGKIFFLDASLTRLCATKDRPLSDTEEKLKNLYTQRIDIYKSTADVTVPPMDTPMAEAEYIISNRMELAK